MEARIHNPVITVDGAMKSLVAFSSAAEQAGLPKPLLELLHLRVSQINGCSVCVLMHSTDLRKGGESDERLSTVAAWRDTPFYTDAERAALALAEAVTRIADRPEPVTDDVWDEAARHYSEPELAALVLDLAAINAWNRINIATRQVAGAAWA